MPKILMNGDDVGVILRVDDGQTLGRFIGKLLLDDERHGDLIALIEVLVGNKAVHLGPQCDRLDETRDDHMEHGIGELLFLRVLLFQIRVHVCEVDGFPDVSFIVAAVRVDQRRNEMHAVEIAQQDAVLPVAEATLFLFHKNKSHTLLRRF